MGWRDKVGPVVQEHLKTEGAQVAVMAMYGAINSTTAVLTGDLSDENKIGVGQMLVDLSYGLHTNPFMMEFGSRMWPVFQTAVNAYVDHLEYIESDNATRGNAGDEATAEIRSRVLSCSYVKHEIALAALLCEQGGSKLREKSRAFRDALINAEAQAV